MNTNIHVSLWSNTAMQWTDKNVLVVFPVWRHHLQNVNRSSGVHFQTLLRQFVHFWPSSIFKCVWLSLKTDDEQFTLPTKKHCISSLSRRYSHWRLVSYGTWRRVVWTKPYHCHHTDICITWHRLTHAGPLSGGCSSRSMTSPTIAPSSTATLSDASRHGVGRRPNPTQPKL